MATNTFYLDYNVTGAERKRLIKAISAYTGADAKYLYAPSFSYMVDRFTIDKNGVVSFDGSVGSEEIEGLTEALVQQGFVAQTSNLDREDELEEAEQAPASEDADGTEPDPAIQGAADAEPEESTEDAAESKMDAAGGDSVLEEPAEAGGLTVSLPMDGFTEGSLANLRKLVDSKSSLIRKALGADRLDIKTSATAVSFPWFDTLPEPEETQAYTAFIAGLSQMAKGSKRVTATEKSVENEKYAFRCFLLRLGFIGAENKAQRKILLRRLSGSSAFPSKEKADAFSERQRAKRTAQKEAAEA